VRNQNDSFRYRKLSVVLVIGLLVSGCVSAPQYDATTDSDISSLQNEIDSELVQWTSLAQAGDAASLQKQSYAQNTSFYDKVDSDLETLELRLEAVQDPSTANMPQYFSNIRAQIANLKALHEKNNNLDALTLKGIRPTMNLNFAILLTYELSLKGVASNNSTATSSTATSVGAKNGGK